MKQLISLLILANLLINTNAQQRVATISFDKEVHDFGKIKEEQGPVTYKFSFTNTGGQPLIITKVEASCGCTTPDWTKEPVPPGSKGFVAATYNPKGRPGKFSKTITVTSNAQEATKILTITGEVIQREKTIQDEFPKEIGVLRLKTDHVSFSKMSNTDIRTETIQIINTGTEPIKITFESVPSFITLKANPETLSNVEGKNRGTISVTYNAKEKNDWGFVSDRFGIVINGKSDPTYRVTVSAIIEEDFSLLTPEQLANAPIISWENTEYNFGTTKEGTIIDYEYNFTNTGKSDLIIRKTKASCGCTAIAPSESIIKPGEKSSIKIKFNTSGKTGNQQKTITVITNDPKNTTTILKITGMVEGPTSNN